MRLKGLGWVVMSTRENVDDTPDDPQTGSSSSDPCVIEGVAEEAPRRRFARRSALITDAKVGPGQDRLRREKQYAFLQFLRVPSLLLGAFFLVMHWYLAATIALAVSVPLPWIAVVLGNGRGQKRDERERMVYRPALARQQQQHYAQLERERTAELPASRTIDHDDPQ